ncbi:MAG: NAD(P)H-dependent oxidoreductase, partial [Hydrogenophilales bacterium 17-62-8]
MPTLLDAIQQRYACHQFVAGQTVGASELSVLREAGRLAPSAFGLEPWRFITVTDETERAILAHACYDQPAAATAAALIVIVALVDALDPDSDYVRA